MRWFVMVAILLGCSDPAGCGWDQIELEIFHGSILEAVQKERVRDLRSEGWRCVGESIRNGFGGEVGVRYLCESCD